MIPTNEQMSLIALLEKGGWVMIPLVLCSLIAVAIIVEKLIWGLRLSKILPKTLAVDIQILASQKKYQEIMGVCRASDSSLARIVRAIITKASTANCATSTKLQKELNEVAISAGRVERTLIQKYLGALGTIAAISPLLGLLGTVSGMIQTFAVINVHGVGNAGALSGGIAEALITTATGLTIAIPAVVFHRYLTHRARTLISDLEHLSERLIENLVSDFQPRTKNDTVVAGSFQNQS